MIFCEECGARLDDDARFCDECGAEIIWETPQGFHEEETNVPVSDAEDTDEAVGKNEDTTEKTVESVENTQETEKADKQAEEPVESVGESVESEETIEAENETEVVEDLEVGTVETAEPAEEELNENGIETEIIEEISENPVVPHELVEERSDESQPVEEVISAEESSEEVSDGSLTVGEVIAAEVLEPQSKKAEEKVDEAELLETSAEAVEETHERMEEPSKADDEAEAVEAIETPTEKQVEIPVKTELSRDEVRETAEVIDATAEEVTDEIKDNTKEYKGKKRLLVVALGVVLIVGVGIGALLGNRGLEQKNRVDAGAEVTLTASTAPTATLKPVSTETPSPTSNPTVAPTPSPTLKPTATPTPSPTPKPTATPTPSPTLNPTATPTPSPTLKPTATPTPSPTPKPTATPTPSPTPKPTATPTPSPTLKPTATPTPSPTPKPTVTPPAKMSEEDEKRLQEEWEYIEQHSVWVDYYYPNYGDGKSLCIRMWWVNNPNDLAKDDVTVTIINCATGNKSIIASDYYHIRSTYIVLDEAFFKKLDDTLYKVYVDCYGISLVSYIDLHHDGEPEPRFHLNSNPVIYQEGKQDSVYTYLVSEANTRIVNVIDSDRKMIDSRFFRTYEGGIILEIDAELLNQYKPDYLNQEGKKVAIFGVVLESGEYIKLNIEYKED